MNRMLSFALIGFSSFAFAQGNCYWQQKVSYKMDVKMDVKTYKYTGNQELEYWNNSPDTLKKVYFHLYPNAFQPGSEMDMRVRSIKDPDGRMVTKKGDVKESRIKNLKPNEIGFLNVSNFKQDGNNAAAQSNGTILIVDLAKPILPNSTTKFSLDFDGQVPIQIRRSGRNNSEGVELSMSQWYPKLAEYDFEGWHADPYIAREFYGVWGDFDVNITIDKDYVIGGSGYLQNPNEIGHGYASNVTYPKNTKTLTWHFIAPNVHDFTWAADKNYIHDTYAGPNGVDLHFFYLDDAKHNDNWKKLQPYTATLMDIYNKTVGNYPYKQYSVIQGGDGGMEYAMCTLILGNGDLDGLIGVTAHEMGHSWFQHILGSNESKHGWMDEGFTSFLEDYGLNKIAAEPVANPFSNAYKTYASMANSGTEQPLSTHADRFDINRNYSISSYVKGELFLTQLIYLIGEENFMKTLKRYYSDFKFKHPNPNDIKRVAEKVSGAMLDWYLVDWTQTTNTIDYGIKSVTADAKSTMVSLERIGRTPMPMDVLVEYENGEKEYFYIPLRMMDYQKPNPFPNVKRTVLSDWPWAQQQYEFKIDGKLVKSVQLDPQGLMADVKPENNSFKK
ncbi:M1 family metallopeptidase [Flavobacterium silvaticum]|uniref:M1 family metallopeptidase n=1 Tax=Flavobacterium silvaticum TaxID=1852020 RepID=A0A972FSA9_9FLAO|nr:M1 family metallopeptidase [Flavobacterium silvaticum]NMH28444.1 M1 family metallopeptidase [Flavobacterium silvaticum]